MQEVFRFIHIDADNITPILLALVPALLNLGIVFYILTTLPRRAVTRVFAAFTFALAMWQIDDVFSRLCESQDCILFWDELLSIAWIAFAPLGLYFSLLYTNHQNLAKRSLVIGLIFLPLFLFEGLYNTDIFPHYFYKHPFWGWVNPHNQHWVDELMVLWLSLQVVIMVILLWRHAWKVRKAPILNKQALLIALGITIPAVQGIATQTIMPVLLETGSVPATSFFMTFFSLATVVAFSRYRLFNLTEAIRAESLLESLSEIVFTITPDQRILYVNRYGMELLGLNPKQNHYTLKQIFPEEGRYQQFLQNVVRPALKGTYIENYSFILKTPYGGEIDVLVTADPIIDRRKVIGLLMVAYDVSDIKKAERSVREKNIALERSNAELETFAFVASHDLKEPLRMVSNYTQLLANRYKDKLDGEAQEFINFAVEGVFRMQELINDLLEYSRIGKGEVEAGPVDLNEVVELALKNVQAHIESAGASIKIPAKLPVVNGNKTQLLRLMQNLIDNAMKFVSEERKPEIEITAEQAPKEGMWRIAVKDNGIGISSDYKHKIFILFQRLHERGKYPGTGIGLSICKKIVELQGGRIWFESEEGKGTTFYFLLPRVAEDISTPVNKVEA